MKILAEFHEKEQRYQRNRRERKVSSNRRCNRYFNISIESLQLPFVHPA
jgi:hypothetical protein